MLRAFVDVSAFVYTFGASIFLLRSNLGLSDSVIEKASSTYCGFNRQVVENLAKQKADTSVGVGLLLLSFLLQLFNTFYRITIDDLGGNKCGAVIAILVGVVVIPGCHMLSKKMSSRTINRFIGNLRSRKGGKSL